MLDRPFKYTLDERTWEFSTVEDERIRAGERLEGHIEYISTSRPPATEVTWIDGWGRAVETVQARYDPASHFAHFTFTIDRPLSIANRLVARAGRHEAEAVFHIVPDYRPWDRYPVIDWAHNYPAGYYDDLRKMGITGTIAYKQQPIEHIIENNLDCYAEQISPYELAVYHRPYFLNQEITAELKAGKYGSEEQRSWGGIRNRYKRARAEAGDRSVAADSWLRKSLWRHFCWNDPNSWPNGEKLIKRIVDLRRSIRPLYYSMVDEPGTGDQTAPMDFCFCGHCLLKMRGWLETRYHALGALNVQWDTDFTRWSDVMPFTFDDILRRYKQTGSLNLSPWSDHRTFMDDTFAEACSRLAAAGRSADPQGLFGVEGCQTPACYGGYDYSKLVHAVDVIEHYNLGANDEIIRSIAPEGLLKLICYFGDDAYIRVQMWYQLLHGDKGQIHWDANFPEHTFMHSPGRKPTAKAKTLAPTMLELTRGAAEQMYRNTRPAEKIAFHYSQPSIQANWAFDRMQEKTDWVDRDSGAEYESNPTLEARYGWVKLIEDLGHQHRFIEYQQIERGALETRGISVFIMNQSLAISSREARTIRRWVENGGTLIADVRPAVMDEHCKLLPKGQLDAVFGVRCTSYVNTRKGLTLTMEKPGREGLPSGRLSLRLSEKLTLTRGAVARATAGGHPAMIENVYGKGRAFLMNAGMEDYQLWRLSPGSRREKTTQAIVRTLVDEAGVRAEAMLVNQDGRFPPGYELIPFDNGAARLNAIVLNELRRYDGVGKLVQQLIAPFKPPQKVTLTVDRDGWLYEARSGKAYGYGNTVKTTLNWLEPRLIWSLPYEVKGVNFRAIVSRGQVTLVAKLDVARNADLADHLFRVDMYNPKGDHVHIYSANLAADENGRVTHPIRLALNDRKGRWKATVRDMITGQTAEVGFKV